MSMQVVELIPATSWNQFAKWRKHLDPAVLCTGVPSAPRVVWTRPVRSPGVTTFAGASKSGLVALSKSRMVAARLVTRQTPVIPSK